MSPLLLSRSELPSIVKLSVSSIRRLETLGRFPSPILLGDRRVAYRVSDITRWLEERPAARGSV